MRRIFIELVDLRKESNNKCLTLKIGLIFKLRGKSITYALESYFLTILMGLEDQVWNFGKCIGECGQIHGPLH